MDMPEMPQSAASQPVAPQTPTVATAPTNAVTEQQPAAPSNNRWLFIGIAIIAIALIAGAVMFNGKLFKGSFDIQGANDFKITSFAATVDQSGVQFNYELEQTASNVMILIAKDMQGTTETRKLFALSDSDMQQGQHTVKLDSDEMPTVFKDAGTYIFKIIAYNSDDEITDMKQEDRTVTVDNGTVKIGDTTAPQG